MTRRLTHLHFDLSGFSPDLDYRLLCGVAGGLALQRYEDHPTRLEQHRSQNRALGSFSEQQCSKITHFVEDVDVPARGLYLHQVVSPSLDDHPLPELHMVAFHIGEDDVRRALRTLRAYKQRALLPSAVAHYGLDTTEAITSSDDFAAIHLGAGAIKPPGVTAQTLVLHHPEIATADGAIAKYVLDTYVSNTQPFQDLVQYIQQNGPGTDDQWYNKSWSMWSENSDGTGPMVPADPDLDLTFKEGKKADWPVNPDTGKVGMPSYQLTDEYDPPVKTGSGDGVVGAAAPIVQEVLKLTKDDKVLNGALWNRQDGTTEKLTENTPPTLALPELDAASTPDGAAGTELLSAGPSDAAKAFAVKNVTSSYGLWTYEQERSFDYDTKTFVLPVKNWPSRYLGAYVQFVQSDGTVITRDKISATNPADPTKPFTWDDNLPIEFVRPFVEPSDTKNFLQWISSGAAVLGAPVPPLTQKADLSFLWPDAASRARILVGGLGAAAGFSDWDSDVDLVGLLGTCLINYGIGVVTLVAGVYIVNPFIEFLQDGFGSFAFFAICGVIGAPALVVGVAEADNSFGKYILSKLSGIVASALFGAGAKRLIERQAVKAAEKIAEAAGETAAEITAEEAVEQVPVAGWALKIASIAADLAGLAATTVESLASPATYEIDVLRTMDLTVTVKPDPAHGKAGFKPVWPAVSEHFVVQVKYPGGSGQNGGTTYTKAGPMPGQSDEEITVVFEGIPAGGKIEVSGNIYSDTDWLCGRWDSGWINALPDAQNQLSAGGSITEFLVPLTPTTSYSQKQTVAYSPTDKHYWNVSSFSVPSALTPDFDAGGTPSSAISNAFAGAGNSLSPNAAVSVVAPGQKWSISDPVSGDVFQIDLHQIYVGEVFSIDLSSVKSALDAGGSTPASVESVFSSNNYPLDAGTEITVISTGQEWSIGAAGQPPAFVIVASAANAVVSQTSFDLTVQNTARPAPPLPAVYPLPQAPSGNQLGALQNIIHNNTEYELGYAWMASGQNLPLDDGTAPTNVPMYAMQSISTLGQPQDQIIEPTRGFSLPTLIAYDQFGLTELFPLAMSFVADLVAGPVAAQVADEFAAFGRTLPSGATVTVLTAGSAWTIDDPSSGPIYQLEIITEDDKSQHIGVFAYPIPGLDNFYLDPRDHSQADPVYYLRGVDLKQGPGEFEFDYDTSTAWGRILNQGSLQALAVHPQGYVIGVDFVNHKMYSLKLPAQAAPSDQTPFAMPLAGEGVLEGLMRNPQALTITADGRILILEEGNRRIQAFDVKGNAVSCFSVDQPSFQIASSYSADLDDRQPSPALLGEFQKNTEPTLAPRFTQSDPADSVAALDAGTVDESLAQSFVDRGYAKKGDGPSDYRVTVTTSGSLWLVTNTTSQASFDVRLKPDNDEVDQLFVYSAPVFTVTIKARGLSWQLTDTVASTRYDVSLPTGSKQLTVQKVVSYMPLRDDTTAGITYLDIAVEPKGYIYVLMVEQTTGQPTFLLDIYNPDGSTLLDKPQAGVNAARLTIDQWRSMFTLNYNVVLGPNGRTEPGVSQWIPSTPDPATKG